MFVPHRRMCIWKCFWTVPRTCIESLSCYGSRFRTLSLRWPILGHFHLTYLNLLRLTSNAYVYLSLISRESRNIFHTIRESLGRLHRVSRQASLNRTQVWFSDPEAWLGFAPKDGVGGDAALLTNVLLHFHA